MTISSAFALALVALLVSGCPGKGSAPSSKCEKVGAQCQLTPSNLGVCSEARCEEGRMPPCLECMSQH